MQFFILYNFLMYQKKDGADILLFDSTSVYNNAICFIDK